MRRHAAPRLTALRSAPALSGAVASAQAWTACMSVWPLISASIVHDILLVAVLQLPTSHPWTHACNGMIIVSSNFSSAGTHPALILSTWIVWPVMAASAAAFLRICPPPSRMLPA